MSTKAIPEVLDAFLLFLLIHLRKLLPLLMLPILNLFVQLDHVLTTFGEAFLYPLGSRLFLQLPFRGFLVTELGESLVHLIILFRSYRLQAFALLQLSGQLLALAV